MRGILLIALWVIGLLIAIQLIVAAQFGRICERTALSKAIFAAHNNLVLVLRDRRIVEIWRPGGDFAEAVYSIPDTTYGIAFAPDGSTFLTGNSSGVVRLWETATGQLRFTLRGQAGVVENLFYSPDGAAVITAGNDDLLRVWDATTGRELRRTPKPRFSNIAYAPDGNSFAAIGFSNSPQLYNASSGQLIGRLVGHREVVSRAAYSADNRTILTGSFDRTARLWNAQTGALLMEFVGHTANLTDVGYSPDGTTALTASCDNTARLWDSATGKPISTFLHSSCVESAMFSPDGKSIVTATRDGVPQLWDARSGAKLDVLCPRLLKPIYGVVGAVATISLIITIGIGVLISNHVSGE